MRVKVSSAVRAGGTALAVLLPRSLHRRTLVGLAVTGAADAVARILDPAGLEVVSVSPSGDLDVVGASVSKGVVRRVSASGSWIAANLVAVPVLRRLPGPRLFAALAAGGAIYAADRMVTQQLAAASTTTGPVVPAHG